MPNWCYNFVEIEASSDAINQLLQKAKGPVSPGDDEIVEFSYLPFVATALPEKYEENWYSSNCETIGSKWFPYIDVIDAEEGRLSLSFDSAWSPTTEGTERIAEWLRNQTSGDFSITHSYEELGMAFCGVLTITRDNKNEQYGDIRELEWDDPILANEEETLEFCREIGVSPEQLRKYLDQRSDQEYVRFIPEFYADHGRCEDVILPCFATEYSINQVVQT